METVICTTNHECVITIKISTTDLHFKNFMHFRRLLNRLQKQIVAKIFNKQRAQNDAQVCITFLVIGRKTLANW